MSSTGITVRYIPRAPVVEKMYPYGLFLHGASDLPPPNFPFGPSHAFGLKGDVGNNIAYLDEQTVIYPAGANTIIYNTESKVQRFIPVTDKCEGITAMALSGNKRYVAVSERGERPVCNVYDTHSLRRKKSLVAPETESKEFVCVAFSSDARYIITQSGAPDWTLYYWSWEKSKLMSTVRTANTPVDRTGAGLYPPAQNAAGSGASPANAGSVMVGGTTPGIGGIASVVASATQAAAASATAVASGAALGGAVSQISFNPSDPAQLCAVGNGVFKLFRYQDGTLKAFSFQKVEPKNYLCHCWVPEDRIVVGTEDGKLFLFESNGEQRAEIQHLHSSTLTPIRIQALLGYSKGFICGGSGGSVAIYERNDELPTGVVGQATQSAVVTAQGAAGAAAPSAPAKEFYKKGREFLLHDKVMVMSLALSPSEDNVICSVDTCQIFSMMLASTEMKVGPLV
ncbi:WD40-repeat-containing domain protein [Blyttiomyces helicus]|uniref:WD40-repeat-containing domain protein n=1 Tax=Blyttiomyces helicus TaxID=388810 RepID=A0A4P9W8E1_9FUNG|nr:WD40-repeat-containing domain protein [Blyttiomyces helicus]|eukprot:RKO87723.1 WD40-repeat-containing domain protein [Blyttiomyces helicus]